MSDSCPFCNRDPFDYVDNGVGMEAVAVTCCELGDQFFRGMRPDPEEVTLQWDEFQEIGSKLAAAASRIEALEAENARLRRDCAEAYQVVGTLAAAHIDLFNDPQVVKALDNLSAAVDPISPRPHDDLLPFAPILVNDPLQVAESRADAAESALAEAVEVLRPLGEAAADICEQSRDDQHIWEAPCAMNITRGHLRAARAFVQQHEGKK